MGKLFYLMGKSASGKDTIFRTLSEDQSLALRKVTMYTTRPMRDGEMEGREYFFRDTAFFEKAAAEGKVIESRTYQTVFGPWTYFTMDDGQIDLAAGSYLMIGTPESFANTVSYFRENQMEIPVPLYITVEDGVRLQRALNREKTQEYPKYSEMCRRFLADEADFAPEKLKEYEIETQFENEDLESCMKELKNVIRKG